VLLPAAADQNPPAEDEWASWPEGDSPEEERRRYFSFRHRFRYWLREEVKQPGDQELAVRALEMFGKLTRKEKQEILRRFHAAADLPAPVLSWMRTQWPDPANFPGGGGKHTAGWLYAKSVLLTYNGDYSVLPGIRVAPKTPWKEIRAEVERDPEAERLWKDFLGLLGSLQDRYKGAEWAVSQEISMESVEAGEGVRLHHHLYLKSGAKMWSGTDAPFRFRGVAPHRSPALGVFSQRQVTGYAGLYYVTCPKIGKVRSECCKQPWSGFLVSVDWVLTLLTSGKMDYEDAKEESARSSKGLTRRLQDLEKWDQLRREAALKQRVAEIRAELCKTQLAFHAFPAIDCWRLAAERPAQRRKKFLVLEGGSGLGKTEYVRALYGPEKTLELNCSSCGEHPDLRGHDPLRHRCVLFDEAEPRMVLRNRKAFQAPPCEVDMGHSPTGRDVYRVFLNDSVLVVCSNVWSPLFARLENESDREWLSANSVHIVLHGPMFAADA
jgi:hypothetical protein